MTAAAKRHPEAAASPWRSLRAAARLQHGEGRRLGSSILLSLGGVAAATGLLTTSGYLISRAAQHPEILTLTAAITAVRAFGIARAALRYAERLVSHDFALRVLARLRASCYAVLAPLGPSALGPHRRGELLSRFVADVDSLQDLYLRGLAPPLVAALVIGSAALTGALILPIAALAIGGGLLAAAVVIPLVAGTVAAQAGRRQAPARAVLASELVEAVDGSVELAVAGRGGDRVERLRVASAGLTAVARRDALAGAASSTLATAMSGLTVLAVLVVAIPAVHRGTLDAVLLAAVVFLVFGAFEGIAPLSASARSLRGCAESALRLDELRALAPTVTEPVAPLAMPDPGAVLQLEGVGFRYPGDRERPLECIDLTLEPGCRVVLTGPSGAGKTTLAQLLVRFLDPDRGRITLDGVDLRDLALDDVRRTVVLAAQDAHVFTTTIRENLLLARRDATEAELWAALAVVRLDRWVASLPDRIDTLLGEDGRLASGGQRQRLALARALVADARLIVLDEPTAHLDSDTARALIEGISRAAGRRGLLIISHRTEGLHGFESVHLRHGRLT